MNYKIVVDSCCDLTEEYRKDEHFVVAPLTLTVDGVDIVDDETFDQKDFLRRVSESKECPHSACPSPERYLKEYENFTGDIYVVTLSAELSGSYNSAVVARQMYEENGGKNSIHVFNSCSASVGETLIALKVQELAQEGKSFEEVVELGEKFREEMTTHFVLESLETLRKNGRLTTMQAIIAKTLNIKPIMKGTEKGTIEKVEQTRGMNKALERMTELIAGMVENQDDKILAIAQCNNMERALYVKKLIEEKCHFKKILIFDTAGVSSMYANDGGIIVCA